MRLTIHAIEPGQNGGLYLVGHLTGRPSVAAKGFFPNQMGLTHVRALMEAGKPIEVDMPDEQILSVQVPVK